MLVACIDVGIVNLALVVAEVTPAWEVMAVVHAEVADTRVFEHTHVPMHQCMLGHAKTTTDRVTHFVQERAELLDACETVLIERQPLQGHTDVQEVLFLLFRTKAELVSPNSMHKHFQISQYTYEGRKQQTVRLATEFFTHLPACMYHFAERKHDMADALCLLLYWLHVQRSRLQMLPLPVIKVKAAVAEPDATHAEAVENFKSRVQRFAYTPKK